VRILLTNRTLAERGGTQTYVRDLATALLRRGHAPVVYSPRLGEVADEIRSATIPVIDDLATAPFRPDVIHGHHHPETMTALLHHRGVPAVFVCHDWQAWHDVPPRFPRILRYVAVDETCRDRLVLEEGIPEANVELLLNFVDLQRFGLRPALPQRPAKALVFGNDVNEAQALPAIREACARHAIALDVLGSGAGTASRTPERVLGAYDLVFARGRSAIEAMAVGCAVILSGSERFGEMVTTARFEGLRRLNFGRRRLQRPFVADAIAAEIGCYDASDAAAVTERLRAVAGLESAVDRWIALYGELDGQRRTSDADGEWRAAAQYVRAWEKQWTILARGIAERESAQRWLDGRLAERERDDTEHQRLAREHAELAAACGRLRAELAAHHASTAVRLRNRIVAIPGMGRLARALARYAAGR